MPQGLRLPQRQLLHSRRVYPLEKLQVTQLDWPLLRLRSSCERVSFWAKLRVKQSLKAMRRSPLKR